MPEEKILELKSVIARFGDSASALDALTERISAISAASSEISMAQAGITEAHLQLRKLVEETSSVASELKTANASLRSAIEAFGQFIEGTNLSEMQKGIQGIADSITTTLNQLNQKLAEKTEAEVEHARTITDLQAKIAMVPERVQKKLGWK